MRVGGYVSGDPFRPGGGFKSDLYFDDWTWTECISRYANSEDRQLSAQQVVAWAKRRLAEDYWPLELRYLSLFDVPPRFAGRDGKVFSFAPQGWTILGMAVREWDYDWLLNAALWKQTAFLFTREEAFLLIKDVRRLVSCPGPEQSARLLSPAEAAKWCEEQGVDLPPSLESHRTIEPLTPTNAIALLETEARTTNACLLEMQVAFEPLNDDEEPEGLAEENAPSKTSCQPILTAPPPWSLESDEWIFSATLAKLVGKSGRYFCERRKAAKHKKQDAFGEWGIDEVGVFRTAVFKGAAAYYLPRLKPVYKSLYQAHVNLNAGP